MPDPICPKCKEAMADLGRTTCPGCGTPWHWNERAGTLREMGHAFSPAQKRVLVNGLALGWWYALASL